MYSSAALLTVETGAATCAPCAGAGAVVKAAVVDAAVTAAGAVAGTGTSEAGVVEGGEGVVEDVSVVVEAGSLEALGTLRGSCSGAVKSGTGGVGVLAAEVAGAFRSAGKSVPSPPRLGVRRPRSFAGADRRDPAGEVSGALKRPDAKEAEAEVGMHSFTSHSEEIGRAHV